MSKDAQEKLIEVLRLLAREARFPQEQMAEAIEDLDRQLDSDEQVAYEETVGDGL